MATRDLTNNIDVQQSIAPAAQAASANGTGIDTRNADSAVLVFSSGAVTASGNITPTVEESDDNATYTAVAAADLDGTLADPLTADSVTRVGYTGSKRYVRPVLTLNSGTSVVVGVDVILGHLHQAT